MKMYKYKYTAIGKILRRMPVAIGLIAIMLMFVGSASAASAPIVTVYSPNGGEVWSGIQNIIWDAIDPDGDPLSITIQYYRGTEWINISEDEINNGNFSWDTRYMPDGGNYLIKVIANDGTSTAEDQSDATFEIDNPLDIMINEIYYKTHGNDLDLEFIELYVYDDGGSGIDISGWYVTTYDAEGNIALPYISNLDDFDFIVIRMGEGINDTDASDGVATIYLNLTSPILDNTGDEVGLYDSFGNIYDFVRYKGGNGDPVLENWQLSDLGISANTTSESIQVHGADLDDSTNWVSATASEGEASIYEFWLDDTKTIGVEVHNGNFLYIAEGSERGRWEPIVTSPVALKTLKGSIRKYAKNSYRIIKNDLGFSDGPLSEYPDGKIRIYIQKPLNKNQKYTASANPRGLINIKVTKPLNGLNEVVLAHEMMHLFQNKIKKYNSAWDSPENKFIREGIAEYAGRYVLSKDTDFKLDLTKIWELSKDSDDFMTLDAFLKNTDGNFFTEWRGSGHSYAGSYLFIKYIVDNYGANKLKPLITQTKTKKGWASVEVATGGKKKDIFKEWAQWNYLDKKFGATGMYKGLDIQASTYTPPWKTYTGGKKVINKDLTTASIDTTAKADVHVWAADYVEFGVNTKKPFRISFKGDPTAKFVVTALKIKKTGGYEKTVFVDDNKGQTTINKPSNYKKIVLIIARVSNSDGEYTVTIEDKIEDKAEVSFDIPASVMIGEEIDIKGSITAGDRIDLIIKDHEMVPGGNDEPVDENNEFEVKWDTSGYTTGSYTIEGYIDETTAVLLADYDDIDDDGKTTIRLVEPGLTAKQLRDVVAEDDDYVFEGIATGVDDVDYILIGPKGWKSGTVASLVNGLLVSSTSVSDNEFSEEETMTEDLETGAWIALILAPGRDGVYETGDVAGGLAIGSFGGLIAGKNQAQILAIIRDQTVDEAGSDDLLEELRFKVESPYVRLDPIASVAKGEPLNVSGVTNKEPETIITISTFAGPVDLPIALAEVEWPTPDEGVFSGSIDTSDAVLGTYTIEADDGDGNTDTKDVEIVTAVPTPTPTCTTLTGHDDWVFSVAFSPDGVKLASGSADTTIKLWNVSTGKCVGNLTGHDDWVSSVAFSPDGEKLASGSFDNTIKLWDVAARECVYTLTDHDDYVLSVAFSPEGEKLASGSADNTIKLWDVAARECIYTLTDHDDYVLSVAFSSDGEKLASGSADNTVKLWNVSTGNCVDNLADHDDWVRSVAFSSDDTLLASGSDDTTIKLWNVSTGKCVGNLTGHDDWVNSVAFNPFEEELLASGSDDTTIKLWDVATCQCMDTFTDHDGWVLSVAFSPKLVAFSPKGSLLASGSEDKKIKLRKVSKKLTLKIEVKGQKVNITLRGPSGHDYVLFVGKKAKEGDSRAKFKGFELDLRENDCKKVECEGGSGKLDKSGKAVIELSVSDVFNFRLFNWDNVPGDDNKGLLEFLKDDHNINWAEKEKAKINKINVHTIRISNKEEKEKYAEITLDEKEGKATLEINDGRTRKTHYLKVKKEDGKLEIYSKPWYQAISGRYFEEEPQDLRKSECKDP